MEENNNNNNKNQTINIVGFILSFIMPLIGLIVSIIGISKSKKTGVGKGFSIAGIVISSIFLLIRILAIVLFILFSFNVVKNIDFNDLGEGTKCVISYDCELNNEDSYTCKYKINDVEENITCDKKYINEFNMKKIEDNNQVEDENINITENIN